MLCDNCGKNEANIRLTQIINGKKTEMIICEQCGEKLGITSMDFEMPIDISNFLGDFMLENDDSEFMPFNTLGKALKCNRCNITYKEFLDNGKFGCEECYKTFEDKIDILVKKIQGTDKYLGRKARNSKENQVQDKKAENKTDNQIQNLQIKLKQAIKEERYEDAAKIRDEIKKLEEI